MLVKKISFSLLGLGVAGGTGGGIYYVINKEDGNKPQEKSEKKFSGYFILKEKNKTDDNKTSKVYEVTLEENLESEKPTESEICKLGSDNSLICKVSDIDEQKIKDYLEKLVSYLKEETSEKLKEKLKSKLEENTNAFKGFFKENIYEKLEELLPNNE